MAVDVSIDSVRVQQDARLARLETIVERLATEWERERTEIVSEIRSLRTDWSKSRQFSWAPVGIGMSVIVAVVSLGSTLVWTLISGNTERIQRHVDLPGHTETMVWLERVDTRTKALDAAVDNIENWRLADIADKAENASAINALDGRLSRVEYLLERQ